MSAWMVNKVHIDLMVNAAAALFVPGYTGCAWWRTDENGRFEGWRTLAPYVMGDQPTMTPDELGGMLWDENVRSVDYRYPDDAELPGEIGQPWLEAYETRGIGFVPTPGEVFCAIDCYSYQSCEHPGWEASESFSFCRFLRASWCKLVPGYEQSPWGWEPKDIAQRARSRQMLRLEVADAASRVR
jgi:hypothetical protein